jgi:hypothetical protein
MHILMSQFLSPLSSNDSLDAWLDAYSPTETIKNQDRDST